MYQIINMNCFCCFVCIWFLYDYFLFVCVHVCEQSVRLIRRLVWLPAFEVWHIRSIQARKMWLSYLRSQFLWSDCRVINYMYCSNLSECLWRGNLFIVLWIDAIRIYLLLQLRLYTRFLQALCRFWFFSIVDSSSILV